MAYYGNQPIAGETNSFKVLDDISSYTKTFDGSSAAVVSTSDDTLTFYDHRFVQGQRVTYGKGSGTVITGLTDATVYYVIRQDKDTIQLAETSTKAAALDAVTLSAVGSASGHTLTVAFDGTNTKFKATTGGGTHIKLTRPGQLMISMNGVVQEPQNNTPSNGFGIEGNNVIVFSTAPTVLDTFWGHYLTTNLSSWELSDNKIDNFTGNGSTTTYTLSKTPANADNILVTIDGVTQYPSDSSTTRAYSLNASVVTFTTAPTVNAAIAVRHIGFAGGSGGGSGSGGVTGFYGRTGNVSVIRSDLQNTDINLKNLTGVAATFTGNVSIGGTLTYTDVTNIDAIGIITAQNGINVLANGINVQAGVATFAAAIVSNDDVTFTGVTTGRNIIWDKSNDYLMVKDNARIVFGNSGDLSIRHLSSNDTSYVSSTTHDVAHEFNVAKTWSLMTTAAEKRIHCPDTKSLELYWNGSKKFETDKHGAIITGVCTATSFSGALPISNDSNDRVITATGSGGLNAEASLTFDGNIFTVTQSNANINIVSHAMGSGKGSQIKIHNDHGEAYVGTAGDTTGNLLIHNSSDTHMLFATDNTERFRITDGGQLHVGNSTNNAINNALFKAVADDGEAANTYVGQFINKEATSGESFGVLIQAGSSSADHGFRVKNAANDAFHFLVRGDGKIGIGTDNPGHTLSVQSGGNATYLINGKSSKGVDIFQLYESSNGDGNHGMLYMYDGSGNNDIKLSCNGHSWFNGGSLMIGKDTNPTFSSPEPSLNIEKSSTTTGPLIFLYNGQSAEAGATCEIRAAQNYREANRIVFGRENNSNWQSSAASTGSYTGLFTNSAGTISEKLRITSTGQVLIGRYAWGSSIKPNDQNYLVVSGTSPADSFDSQCYLEGSETSGNANTGGALAFGGHDGSSHRNWANIYGMKENGTGGNVNSYMAFHTREDAGSPAEKLRITSNGTVQHHRGSSWASSTTNGDFTITVSDLTDNGGNNWRKCAVFVMYNGINPDATNSKSGVGYYGVGSVTTWNWFATGEDEEFTADSLNVSLDNATATSFRLNFNVADNNTGSVTVFVNAYSTKPTITIAG